MATDLELEHPLLTVKGFLRFYDTFLPKTDSVRKAYEAAEVEFEAKYNHRRYANFESFMNARAQYRRVQEKQKQRNQQNPQNRQAA